MCGLNGIFAYRDSASAVDEREVIATRDRMSSRGPDGAGIWLSDDRRIGLGHRRLSIIDLSAGGNQPMVSADNRLHIVFNGEIYNHAELRRELEVAGARFRTSSDTEVLLHLYLHHGSRMVTRLRGMFAFAIWDARERSLFLARDPYGIKPLYIADDGGTLRFASQVKALMAGGVMSREPDPAGVVGFELWGSVPEPFTIYRDISALPAGHSLIVDRNGAREPVRYVSIAGILADGCRNPVNPDDAQGMVRQALLDSVRAHLVSDVEVGLFLSAGIDSGALLGLMRDAGQERIRTITLRFDEFAGTREDETVVSGEVARHYGAEHIVRSVGSDEFHREMPNILDAMDQPSVDGVNTWFVSRAAREQGLKVALSGVGGDELLCGYPSYRDIPRWVRALRVPSRIPGLGILAQRTIQALRVGRLSPKAAGMLLYGGDYHGAYLLRRALYLPFELPAVIDPDLTEAGLKRLDVLNHLARVALPFPDAPNSRVAALESTHYLRNQLLRDSDWAGMANSIEIRTPLVDVNLLRALAPVIPRLSAGAGKSLLAAAPSRPLPAFVTERSKTGFGVPTGSWIAAAASGSSVPATKGQASRDWARLLMTNAGIPQQT